MENSKLNNFKTVKLILLGESSVEKSSLIKQYIKRQFESGIERKGGGHFIIKYLYIDGKEIKLQIWEKIGKEKYRAFNKIIMINTQIALII